MEKTMNDDLLEFLKKHKIKLTLLRLDEYINYISSLSEESIGKTIYADINEMPLMKDLISALNKNDCVYALNISKKRKYFDVIMELSFDPKSSVEFFAEFVYRCRSNKHLKDFFHISFIHVFGKKATDELFNNIDMNIYRRMHTDLISLGFSPIKSKKLTDTYVYEKKFDIYHLLITLRLNDPNHYGFDYLSMKLMDIHTGEVYFNEDKVICGTIYEDNLRDIKEFVELYG